MKSITKSTISFALILFASFPAFAEECPTLAGIYKCDARGGVPAYPLRIEQRVSEDGEMNYIFDSGLEGSKTFKADGYEREIQTKLGSGTVQGYCQNDRLTVILRLVGDKGELSEFKDVMYIERGALVRIRRSSPTQVGAYVCRPDFSNRLRH